MGCSLALLNAGETGAGTKFIIDGISCLWLAACLSLLLLSLLIQNGVCMLKPLTNKQSTPKVTTTSSSLVSLCWENRYLNHLHYNRSRRRSQQQ